MYLHAGCACIIENSLVTFQIIEEIWKFNIYLGVKSKKFKIKDQNKKGVEIRD